MTSVCRRQLVAGIMLAGVGWLGREVRAQPSRLIKIGALTESWGPTPAFVGLRDGLVELGYREDKHFTIGVRFTEGRPDDLPAAARDLVRLGVDIIVTGESTTAAKAAQMVTNRIPIVFIGSGDDPVAVGLVKSIARPGANITGIADLDVELAPKRMEIFRELVPTLKRVLLPYNATNPDVAAHVAAHRGAARRLELTLVERPLRSEEEARKALTGLRKGEADGVMSLRFLSLNISGFILEGAPRAMIPTMFHVPYFVERGGLASYSAGAYPLGLQAARLVDKIIKGAKAGEVPVEQPWKFELVVNLKAAKALGLTISPSMRLRVDRVIE
jgi:putative tryptophan/tyrosine transport system substrate-binding protein